MLGDIVPAIQLIVNHDGQRPTTHPIGLGVENDVHYCMQSYIKTSISGPALQEAYHKPFPLLGGNWRTVEANMKVTSLLMQQSSWPYCKLQPPCRRPNASHRANLAVTLGENVHALPLNFHGCQLFNVPLLIFEVEGGKDVWRRAGVEGANRFTSQLQLSLHGAKSNSCLCFRCCVGTNLARCMYIVIW